MQEILAIGVVPGSVRLGFPMEQFPTDRVIRVHGAGGKLFFAFLKSHQERVGLPVGKMQHTHPGLAGGLQICPAESGLDFPDRIPGVQLQGAGVGQGQGFTADGGRIL